MDSCDVKISLVKPFFALHTSLLGQPEFNRISELKRRLETIRETHVDDMNVTKLEIITQQQQLTLFGRRRKVNCLTR